MTALKTEKVSPLVVMRNTPESFCMRWYSFTSYSVHRKKSTLFRMKISDLETMDINKVHLEFRCKYVKSFNQFEKFNDDNTEDTIYVDSLKYENEYSSSKRNEFSNYALEKASTNKNVLSIEKN